MNKCNIMMYYITHQVNFNEPLSFLQRLNEDLIYNDVLNQAVKTKRSCEQICYVAAFASSSYASTVYRTGKPFNPLLGETYDCDRRCEMGWRSLTEQVSDCSVVFIITRNIMKCLKYAHLNNRYSKHLQTVYCSLGKIRHWKFS